jgi:hypothetical protein
MALATWYMGVTPVPPAIMPAIAALELVIGKDPNALFRMLLPPAIMPEVAALLLVIEKDPNAIFRTQVPPAILPAIEEVNRRLSAVAVVEPRGR